MKLMNHSWKSRSSQTTSTTGIVETLSFLSLFLIACMKDGAKILSVATLHHTVVLAVLATVPTTNLATKGGIAN